MKTKNMPLLLLAGVLFFSALIMPVDAANSSQSRLMAMETHSTDFNYSQTIGLEERLTTGAFESWQSFAYQAIVTVAVGMLVGVVLFLLYGVIASYVESHKKHPVRIRSHASHAIIKRHR